MPKPITERAMGIALYKEQTLDAQRPCASFPCASPLEGSLICVCLCVGVREAPGDDILIFVNLGLNATVSQSPLEKGMSAQKTQRARERHTHTDVSC